MLVWSGVGGNCLGCPEIEWRHNCSTELLNARGRGEGAEAGPGGSQMAGVKGEGEGFVQSHLWIHLLDLCVNNPP